MKHINEREADLYRNEKIKLEFATLFDTIKVDDELFFDALVGVSDNKLIISKRKRFTKSKFVIKILPLKINSTSIDPLRLTSGEKLTLTIEKTRVILKKAYGGKYIELKKVLTDISGLDLHIFEEKNSLLNTVVRGASRTSEVVYGGGKKTAPFIMGGVAVAVGSAVMADPDSKSIAGRAAEYVFDNSSEKAIDIATEKSIEYAAEETKNGFLDFIESAFEMLV